MHQFTDDFKRDIQYVKCSCALFCSTCCIGEYSALPLGVGYLVVGVGLRAGQASS